MPQDDVKVVAAGRRAYVMSLTTYGKFWIEHTFNGSYVLKTGHAIHAFNIEYLPEILLKIKEDPKINYNDD